MDISHCNQTNASNWPVVIVINYGALITWYSISNAICIVGAVAGLLLATSLSVKPDRWEGINLLIIHLLIVEIINVTFLAFPHNSAIYWQQSGQRLHIDCVTATFFQYMLLCVVHWTSTVLAANRLIALWFPHHYRHFSARPAIFVCTTLVWLISLADSLPQLWHVGGRYTRFLPLGYCGLLPTDALAFQVIGAFSSTIPFALQGACYGFVLLAMCRDRPSTRVSQRTTTAKRKMGFMLLVACVWSMSCFLPIPIISSYFPNFWATHPLVFMWMRTLFNAGSAGTPCIFILLSQDFRGSIRSLLCQVCGSGAERERARTVSWSDCIKPRGVAIAISIAPRDRGTG